MKSKLISLFLSISIICSIFSPVYAQETIEYPEYVVQSGDTLGQIAQLFNVTVDDLCKINNISDSNNIYPGLALKIPGFEGIKGVITQTASDLGESWQDIIIKYQADPHAIISLNGLTKTTDLIAGTTLLIPVASDFIEFAPKAILSSESTLLEESVKLNQNPFKLNLTNRKESSVYFFTNDAIYDNNPNLQDVNSLSQTIEALTVTPLPLVQGDTVLVYVKTLQPINISGRLNGHELKFYSDDDVNYYALQGIHAMASPGLTDFSIIGTINSEEVFTYSQNIILSAGSFEIDPPLTVSAETVDPTVTVPEMEFIQNLTSIFTPTKYWDGVFLSPDNDYATVIENYELKKEITSFYGNRRTYNDNPEVTFHTGIDFGGGEGLPIVASATGKVVFADFLTVRGYATIIDHGLGVFSAYYHQSEIYVKAGDMVIKGQQIGTVGNTGRVDRSNEYEGAGAHLHWEIWVNGVQVNPLTWVNIEYP
jgi:murein DD-endopeptidase MepM/ murein hydrolase activator NlpD